MKFLSYLVLTLGLLLTLNLELVTGFDPAEAGLARFVCFENSYPGCNETLIERYKYVSKSANKLDPADTFFLLSTYLEPYKYVPMHKCAGEVPKGTTFNPKCRVKFIIPGFVSGVCSMAIFREIKNLIHKRGCYNVINVDWMWGNSFDVQGAVLNSIIVADQIAIVINLMKAKYNMSYKLFDCMGHSIGSQICGMVGKRTHLRAIDGLDCPGIIYSPKNPYHRLNKGDADCVQAMHCNAGQCLPDIGGNYSCGDVDFWINGGILQPACLEDRKLAFMKGDFIYGFFNLYPPACSHFECLQYYRASILPYDCKFIGVKCKSLKDFDEGKCTSCGPKGCNCAIMGFDFCDCYLKKKHKCREPQNYYINTTVHCPYCDTSYLDTSEYHCNLNMPCPGHKNKENKWTSSNPKSKKTTPEISKPNCKTAQSSQSERWTPKNPY